MITIIIFALTAGIGGLSYEFPILETIRHRPFNTFMLIFYAFPLFATFGGGVIGYYIACLISLGCRKTMEEIETATLEPITIGNQLCYLLKKGKLDGAVVYLFFSKDQSGKNIMNEASVEKWVKIREEDRRSAVRRVFKPAFVRPKLKFLARLSSHEIPIISVPKDTIFDARTQ